MPDLLDDIELPDLVTLKARYSLEYRNTGNGYRKAFSLTCDNCGDKFDSNRRQLPGRHAWCSKPECKKAGAAHRARAYRARKEENDSDGD